MDGVRAESAAFAHKRLIAITTSVALLLLIVWANESFVGVSITADPSVPTVVSYPVAPEAETAASAQNSPRFGAWMGNGSAAQLSLLNDSGAKWTRVMVFWSRIEPSFAEPASYDFYYYDGIFEALGKANINVIAEIRRNPDWAASTNCGPIDKPGGQDRFTMFVRAMVSRYSQPPYNIKHWEFYNEPDNTDMGELGSLLGGCWGSYAGAYVDMLRTAHGAVKQVDPGAKVVLGGLAHESTPENFNLAFLDQILAAGAGSYMDIMNIHYYSSASPTWSSYGRDITGKVAAVRQTMSVYGVSKPVAVTEASWTSSAKYASELMEEQAQYVPKLLSRSMILDLHSVLWFSLNDWTGADYPYGLADENMQTRPSYTAFQIAVAELGQAKSVRRLASGEAGTGDPAVEGYAFKVGEQERWLLWSEGANVRISLPTRATEARDKFGNAVPLSGNGALTTLDLGSSPIYVHLTPLPPRAWLPLVAVPNGATTP